jgi:hypothetical protein
MHALRSGGKPMQRDELVAYLDTYLQVKEIEGISNNGLQVEGKKACN